MSEPSPEFDALAEALDEMTIGQAPVRYPRAMEEVESFFNNPIEQHITGQDAWYDTEMASLEIRDEDFIQQENLVMTDAAPEVPMQSPELDMSNSDAIPEPGPLEEMAIDDAALDRLVAEVLAENLEGPDWCEQHMSVDPSVPTDNAQQTVPQADMGMGNESFDQQHYSNQLANALSGMSLQSLPFLNGQILDPHPLLLHPPTSALHPLHPDFDISLLDPARLDDFPLMAIDETAADATTSPIPQAAPLQQHILATTAAPAVEIDVISACRRLPVSNNSYNHTLNIPLNLDNTALSSPDVNFANNNGSAVTFEGNAAAWSRVMRPRENVVNEETVARRRKLVPRIPAAPSTSDELSVQNDLQKTTEQQEGVTEAQTEPEISPQTQQPGQGTCEQVQQQQQQQVAESEPVSEMSSKDYESLHLLRQACQEDDKPAREEDPLNDPQSSEESQDPALSLKLQEACHQQNELDGKIEPEKLHEDEKHTTEHTRLSQTGPQQEQSLPLSCDEAESDTPASEQLSKQAETLEQERIEEEDLEDALALELDQQLSQAYDMQEFRDRAAVYNESKSQEKEAADAEILDDAATIAERPKLKPKCRLKKRQATQVQQSAGTVRSAPDLELDRAANVAEPVLQSASDAISKPSNTNLDKTGPFRTSIEKRSNTVSEEKGKEHAVLGSTASTASATAENIQPIQRGGLILPRGTEYNGEASNIGASSVTEPVSREKDHVAPIQRGGLMLPRGIEHNAGAVAPTSSNKTNDIVTSQQDQPMTIDVDGGKQKPPSTPVVARPATLTPRARGDTPENLDPEEAARRKQILKENRARSICFHKKKVPPRQSPRSSQPGTPRTPGTPRSDVVMGTPPTPEERRLVKEQNLASPHVTVLPMRQMMELERSRMQDAQRERDSES